MKWTNLLPPSLLLWQPGPGLQILGRCRRGHQTISKHEAELFEAEKSRLLNLPLTGCAGPNKQTVTVHGFSRDGEAAAEGPSGSSSPKRWARLEAKVDARLISSRHVLCCCVIWYCQPRIQNPSLTFRWHWLPWWILDTTMPMQCHCHNWLHPNSQKTMSSQMFTTSAFFLDFFKYLILYLIMLRSHSSRILKEKYVLIWKFSTVIWRRLTLLNMFLDGISHHSSSFISLLSILSLFKPASPSFLPF